MRDRPARLLALTALVVGVIGWTGTGQAVREALLPAKSVGTAQLRDNAVTSEKIHGGAIGSSDVRDGSLRSRDLAPGVVPAPLSFVIRRAVQDLSGVGQFELEIPCDTGQTPVAGGGGFLSSTTTSYVGNDFYGSLVNSGPVNGGAAADDRGSATGWIVTARNAGGKKRLAGYVVCAVTSEADTRPGSASATPAPPAAPEPALSGPRRG